MADTEQPQEGEDVQVIDFSQLKKRKKKAAKKGDAAASDITSAATVESSAPVAGSNAAVAPTQEYAYEQLLARVYDALRQNNPQLGEKKRYVMKPPQVVKIGTKKSAWINFQEICNLMHRNPEHVVQFFLAELATDGSIAGGQQLVLKGRYTQKHIESLLRKYITEYVTCHMCKNPDTSLTRDSESRLYFIKCEACNSSRSVAPIKAGFHAVSKQDRQRLKNK
eukprot:GILK01000429.1.p1 GENE.GILK01000429.1~~GILK01000429.1.p1  ORF type:complete len:236 (+),score=29.08 GILK01000429.1:40-708(+)